MTDKNNNIINIESTANISHTLNSNEKVFLLNNTNYMLSNNNDVISNNTYL